MKKNILIVHHIDNDGHMAAAVCMKWVKEKANTDGYEVDIDHVDADYKDTLEEICAPFIEKKKYNEIYVVDVSITKKENAVFLTNLLKDDIGVIYIDHHMSTIKFLNDNPEIKKSLEGIVATGLSASMICWTLYKYSTINTTIPCTIRQGKTYKTINEVMTAIMEVCGTDVNLGRDYVESLWLHSDVPTGLQFVDAYDIWDKNTVLGWGSVLEFAVNNLSVEDCEQLLIDETGAMYTDLLERGAIVKQYEDNHNEILCKQFGYEATIIYNGVKLSVFCLNNPISSSNTFGSRIEEYDILCAYYFNGKNWTHSFYSIKHDCSVLCKMLGGGGHPGASGFQLGCPLLFPGDEYNFDERGITNELFKY